MSRSICPFGSFALALLIFNAGGADGMSIQDAAGGQAGRAIAEKATPDSVFQWIAAAGDSTRWPDADLVAVFDRTDVRVEDSGLGHVRRRTLTKVLTEEGARNQSCLRFDYDPASNMIRIEAVHVLRSGGAVEAVSAMAAVDLPAPADLIYWGARMKLLSLPRLAVGDAVLVETYKKGFQIAYLAGDDPRTGASVDAGEDRYIPPMRGHFYDVVTFQEAWPVRERTYRLRVPRDKPVQYAVYNGTLRSSLTFADSFLVYCWQARDVPAWKEEPRMPDPTDVLPKVVLATVEDWPAKSRWFFSVNDLVFEADPAIRQKVRELTAGLTDDDAKMAVLLHWVAQEIRYSGLSMGKGEGYTLHPGRMTFADRCGVCKDIAGMLVTMLRAAGFTTYPVMTQAGARVDAVPADQFNHCVVAVERPDGSFTMLDPTWAPFDRAVWSRYEGEQHYVIGSPRGEGLQQIRSFRPDESLLTLENRSEIAADGTLSGRIAIRGTGASDGRLRNVIADAPAADRTLAAADLLAGLGAGLEVVDLRATDPRDFSRDASLEVTYRVPRYAAIGESMMAFVPPAFAVVAQSPRLCRLLAFTKEEGTREHEALLWFSQKFEAEDFVDLPPRYRAVGRADSTSVRREAGAIQARFLPEGKRIRTELTATTTKRTVPATEWAGGVEAADSLRALGGRLRWARRGR